MEANKSSNISHENGNAESGNICKVVIQTNAVEAIRKANEEKKSIGTTQHNQGDDQEEYVCLDFDVPGAPPIMGELSDTEKKKIMELKEIKKSIEVGYEVISENEEKAILVIGRTGAGKSTLVNYLIRPGEVEVKSISIENKFGNSIRFVIDAKHQTGYPKIGHSRDAETSIPNKSYDQHNSLAYWDCPGFGDTGGPVKDIPNAFFIKRVFEKAKYVKILLVIEHKDLEGRADIIKTLVDNLTNLFNSIDIIKNSVSLIVTKIDYDKNVNDIKSSIAELLNAQCFIDKPSNGQELLKNLLHSGTHNKGEVVMMTENKISLFKKPTKLGSLPQEEYCNIIEVVNATEFVSSPPVNVTISSESKIYVIDLGYEVKRNLINHFDQLHKEIVDFCIVPSDYVIKANLITLRSLVEEFQKVKSVMNFVVQGDCVDQLSSSVHLLVDNINKSLSSRETSLDVTELAKLIEHDSNYFIFLGSINTNVLSQSNPLSEIHSRMNDGKIEIEDHLTLITGQVLAKLNSEKVSIDTLVISIKDSLLKCIIEEYDLESPSTPDTNFVKCKEYYDMIKNLQLICKKVTDQDTSFKGVINTLEMELIKKYKLEVSQTATDAIRIYDILALIDADDSCDYKSNLQRELDKMFDYIVKVYKKKITTMNTKITKDISGFIDDFCNNLPKGLEKLNNPNDKKKLLKESITIVRNLAESKNDSLTIALNLEKSLKDIGINHPMLLSLEQLSFAIRESNELTKYFDNLKNYPFEKFVKKLNTLTSKLESTYHKLAQDISMQANLEHGIQDFIDDIKKYIRETNSIESTVERLEKVSESFDSLINQYEDSKDISGNDFIKSALIAFQSLDPNLTKHFKYISGAENISSIMITKLKSLKSWLKDDKDWYQSILPEIFLKLNDPNFVEKNGLMSFPEITKENFRDFLIKFKKVKEQQNLLFNSALNLEFNEDRKEQLNVLLGTATGGEMEYSFNGTELTVTGVCIKISQIRHLVNEDVKSIKIKSLSYIFFDVDLKINSANLLIIAPSWHVKSGKNVTIDLSGSTPIKLLKAANAKGYTAYGDGEKGVDGQKGLAGIYGGGFYGCGMRFWGLDRLQINVSGGKGQDGQDGGNGATGKPGAPATRAKRRAPNGEPSWVKSVDQTEVGLLWSYYDKTEKLQGLCGGKGGNAGKGGEGGEGGKPGIAKIFDQKDGKNLMLIKNIIKNPGKKGNNGHSGKPGEGGKNGNDLMVTYHKLYYPWYDKEESISEKSVNVTAKWISGLEWDILNHKCYSKHSDNDEECEICFPQKFDEKVFNKDVKALLGEYAMLLKNLSQSDILYKFLQLNLKDFRIELVGSGPNNDNDQYKLLGEYSNRFNQYYNTGIDQLLTLRLDNLSEIEIDVLALKAEYLYLSDKSSEAVLRLVTKVADAFVAGRNRVLVPYNLHNKHWVGIAIERKLGSIVVHYQDPMQELIPSDLLAKVQETFSSAFPGVNIIFTETCVEKQISDNCGPEVIENFVQYLTGNRVNQEQAVILHSKLLEKHLCRGQQLATVENIFR